MVVPLLGAARLAAQLQCFASHCMTSGSSESTVVRASWTDGFRGLWIIRVLMQKIPTRFSCFLIF